jgi:TldD protein
MAPFVQKICHLKCVVIFLAVLSFASGQAQQQDTLLNVLNEELKREIAELKKAPVPPYYVDYQVNDIEYVRITSSFGSLVQSDHDHSRILKVNVRLGDYQFDNTHSIEQSGMPDYGSYGLGGIDGYTLLPIEDKADAVRFTLWQGTERAYSSALEQYRYIKSPTTKPLSTTVPDFSKESPSRYFEEKAPSLKNIFKVKEWEEKTRTYSSLFLPNKDLISGEILLSVIQQRDYFVSSEGSEIVQNTIHYYLYVMSSIRAKDGDILPLHKTYFGFSPDQLPAKEVIEKDINEMITKLQALRVAPIAEPYTGPAILHAQTAGVFFHEIFGHRVEGHRLKDEMDGQTFRAQVKEQVLPTHISVAFDPTITKADDKLLNGHYKFDNEGIRAQRVQAVENGILKQFLMSRTPLDNFVNSNGHGRSSPGIRTVSRQSNLIVETSKSHSMEDLRKLLVKECKRQGKKYGYLFKDVMGGFTNTDRFTPNAFNIFPTEVYRIYTDGRPDELVRGVDLIGTPLSMFAEITATGKEREVFNGFCGAESGQVPVSALSPALFVKRIETQKKPTAIQDTTLLSRPSN